jgi:hypothetical protein
MKLSKTLPVELGREMQNRLAQERNCRVSTFFDAGVVVELGDEVNGFTRSARFETVAEAALWLHEANHNEAKQESAD